MLPSHSTDSVLEPRPDTEMRILQKNILHTGERDQTDYEKNWETADPVANLNLISSDTGVCPNFSTALTS